MTPPLPPFNLFTDFNNRLKELRIDKSRFSNDEVQAIFLMNVVIVSVDQKPIGSGTWVSIRWPMAKLGKVLESLPKKRKKK